MHHRLHVRSLELTGSESISKRFDLSSKWHQTTISEWIYDMMQSVISQSKKRSKNARRENKTIKRATTKDCQNRSISVVNLIVSFLKTKCLSPPLKTKTAVQPYKIKLCKQKNKFSRVDKTYGVNPFYTSIFSFKPKSSNDT
ncbi:hypothetical protein RHMOL_Rhmol10G0118500 [Rhododendron molle]|uniref:Uncharacterized protein n=1 Tax=Rhododendron molle TaxID=49168 RepID=A0ACC0M1E1_RHOML|nr:hypothetical protein RHMOL_Rhmol10G0118500 [Rhododendron molle]